MKLKQVKCSDILVPPGMQKAKFVADEMARFGMFKVPANAQLKYFVLDLMPIRVRRSKNRKYELDSGVASLVFARQNFDEHDVIPVLLCSSKGQPQHSNEAYNVLALIFLLAQGRNHFEQIVAAVVPLFTREQFKEFSSGEIKSRVGFLRTVGLSEKRLEKAKSESRQLPLDDWNLDD